MRVDYARRSDRPARPEPSGTALVLVTTVSTLALPAKLFGRLLAAASLIGLFGGGRILGPLDGVAAVGLGVPVAAASAAGLWSQACPRRRAALLPEKPARCCMTFHPAVLALALTSASLGVYKLLR